MKTGTNHRGAENKLQNKSPITQNWGPRQKFNKYIVKIIKEQNQNIQFMFFLWNIALL